MKGVLNVKGEDRRQVFHGVHMMFDAQPERPWGDAPAHEQPGVHRPRSRPRRARSRLRIRRREVAAWPPSSRCRSRWSRAPRVAFDDYVVDLRLVAGRQVDRGRRRRRQGGARARRSAIRSRSRPIGEHLLGTLARRVAAARRRCSRRRARTARSRCGTAAPASEIRRWKPAPTPTQALAFSPTGEILASAAGKVVTLWSPAGEKIHAFAPAASSAVALSLRPARHGSRGCPEWRDRGASHREIALRNTALQVAGRLSHGKLQRQWTISRKRHGRWLVCISGIARRARIRRCAATTAGSSSSGGATTAATSHRARATKSCSGISAARAPKARKPDRAERAHRTRRQLRLAAGRRAPRERRPRLAPDAVAARARPNNRSTCRCSIPKSAWCAGRPTANAWSAGEKKGRVTLVRPGGAMNVELRDLTPDERQRSAAALR